MSEQTKAMAAFLRAAKTLLAHVERDSKVARYAKPGEPMKHPLVTPLLMDLAERASAEARSEELQTPDVPKGREPSPDADIPQSDPTRPSAPQLRRGEAPKPEPHIAASEHIAAVLGPAAASKLDSAIADLSARADDPKAARMLKAAHRIRETMGQKAKTPSPLAPRDDGRPRPVTTPAPRPQAMDDASGLAASAEPGVAPRPVAEAAPRMADKDSGLAASIEPGDDAHAIADYKANGTKAKSFKRWFGDHEADPANASKVVDADGKPMVMYHGTAKGGFNEFDTSKIGGDNLYGPGFYFTADDITATSYEGKGVDSARTQNLKDAAKFLEDHVRKQAEARRKKGVIGDTDVGIAIDKAIREVKARGDYLDMNTIKQMEAETGLPIRKALKQMKPAQTYATYLNIRNPFDMASPVAEFDSFANQFATQVAPNDSYWKINAPGNAYIDSSMSGQEIYDSLASRFPKEKITEFMKKAGYDGITHTGGAVTGGKPHKVYIAFDPKQIKSVDNLGTFNPDTARIDLNSERPGTTASPAPTPQLAPPRNPVEQHLAGRVSTKAKAAIASSGIDPKYHEAYAKNVDAVLGAMPEAALRAVHSHDAAFAFHESPQAIMNSLLDPANYGETAARQAKAAHDKGDIFGGVIITDRNGKRTVSLDGGKDLHGSEANQRTLSRDGVEYYAHELAHLIDFAGKDGGDRHSRTDEWVAAWRQDIAHGGVTDYATTSPSEGFAEFGRLLYSGRYDHGKLKRQHPAAFAYFEAHGFVADVEAKAGVVDSPEVFSHKVPLNRQGDHADVAMIPASDGPKPVRTETPEFKRWFGESAARDELGKPLVLYHGARRSDRIAEKNKFDPKRATSGPMAFFTTDPQVADGYATGKADTSLEVPESYSAWFKMKVPGARKPVDIDRAWWGLPPEQRQKIAAIAPRIASNDDGDPEMLDESHKSGVGNYDYEIREKRGNALAALVAGWLDGGILYNREEQFLDVLKMAGLEGAEMHDPHAEHPGVFPVHLAIKNPLNTSSIPDDVYAALTDAAKRKRGKSGSGADPWDKRHISGADWVARLKEDRKGGTTHAWTSIPDWATAALKAKGYDGIKDTGGKNGGREHSVWIPFHPTQIKSAIANNGDYDPDNPRIDAMFEPRDVSVDTDDKFAFRTIDNIDGVPFNFAAEVGYGAGPNKNNWHVKFARYDEDTGDEEFHQVQDGTSAVKTFAFVANSLRKFIDKRDPEAFYFTADQDEASRVKLYDALSRRAAAKYGYTLKRRENGDKAMYVLRKPEKAAADAEQAKTAWRDKFDMMSFYGDGETATLGTIPGGAATNGDAIATLTQQADGVRDQLAKLRERGIRPGEPEYAKVAESLSSIKTKLNNATVADRDATAGAEVRLVSRPYFNGSTMRDDVTLHRWESRSGDGVTQRGEWTDDRDAAEAEARAYIDSKGGSYDMQMVE